MSKSSNKQKLVILYSIIANKVRKEQKKKPVEKINQKVIELQNKISNASR